MTQKGIINLQTYSRPPLLELCLNSISECSNSIDFEKIIVLQVGNKEVESLVEAFCAKNRNSIIIRVDGQEKSPLQNMNWNRWKAWQHGFDNLGADWILSIEEDVVIHPKSIDFVCEVMIRMSNQKHFRGINLGSKLADPELNCTYSKLRFGLHARYPQL